MRLALLASEYQLALSFLLLGGSRRDSLLSGCGTCGGAPLLEICGAAPALGIRVTSRHLLDILNEDSAHLLLC